MSTSVYFTTKGRKKMEHSAEQKKELEARSQNPEFRRKTIKIDLICGTAFLNRRMSNKEF